MQLHLLFPPPWQIKHGPNDQLAAILPGSGPTPELIVTYGPIALKPDDPRRWLEQICRDVRPGTKVTLGRAIDLKTTAGWPLRLVEAELTTDSGDFVEARLCAFYTFMEHAAAATVRAGDRTRMESHGKAVLAILQGGGPDWRDAPICLADAWDLEVRHTAPARVAPRPPPDRAALEQALAAVDPASASAHDHMRRGLLLLDLKRAGEARDAFAAAIARDDRLEMAHYHLGIALGELGHHAEAITAWRGCLELAPELVDAHYNIAQAEYLLEHYDAALAGFETVAQRDPDDLAAARKVIQCLYALARYDEGLAARTAFRRAWASARDPRARHIAELVFDQFAGDGFWVHAVQTLRPHTPAIEPLLSFRAVQRIGDRDQSLAAAVVIETSEPAKAAGTPFVIGVLANTTFRVVSTRPVLPPYAELKQMVVQLLRDALTAYAPTPNA